MAGRLAVGVAKGMSAGVTGGMVLSSSREFTGAA
jgi:hypothetical protein